MSNEQTIWNLLMKGIGNPYGVAGLMGNLMAESSLNPLSKTGGSADIKKLSTTEYANRVHNGTIIRDQFAHDGVAFGLVQWCFWSRKAALWDYAHDNKLDIRKIKTQIGYLLVEIKKYKAVWTTIQAAATVKEASDIVMLKYEKPANTSDAMKARRERYGEGYLAKYGPQKKRLTLSEMLDIVKDVSEKKSTIAQRKKQLAPVIEELENRIKEEAKC